MWFFYLSSSLNYKVKNACRFRQNLCYTEINPKAEGSLNNLIIECDLTI